MDRSPLWVGVAGVVSTLVGVVAGVVVTLEVGTQQQEASLDQEIRARRAEVYPRFAAVSLELLNGQIRMLHEREQHCELYANFAAADGGGKACLVWTAPQALQDVRQRWNDAHRDVGIYGTADAKKAARQITWVVRMIDPWNMPFSPTAQSAAGDDEASDKARSEANAAFDDFEAVMCDELPAAGGESCREFLG